MAAALAPERLEIRIDRPVDVDTAGDDRELTGDGVRIVTMIPIGAAWSGFDFANGSR